MLIDDEEGDDALIPSNALVNAASRSQCLIVEGIKSAEHNLTQHLHRVSRMQVV